MYKRPRPQPGTRNFPLLFGRWGKLRSWTLQSQICPPAEWVWSWCLPSPSACFSPLTEYHRLITLPGLTVWLCFCSLGHTWLSPPKRISSSFNHTVYRLTTWWTRRVTGILWNVAVYFESEHFNSSAHIGWAPVIWISKLFWVPPSTKVENSTPYLMCWIAAWRLAWNSIIESALGCMYKEHREHKGISVLSPQEILLCIWKYSKKAKMKIWNWKYFSS